MTVRFKCKDFLLKDCEFEVKGAHSREEMMKIVDIHIAEAHPVLKVSPETLEKIRHGIKE